DRPREQVVFTSGGTEANSLGVLGLAAVVERRGGPRVVAAAAIDHPSLRGPVRALVDRGWRAVELGMTRDGALVAPGFGAAPGAGFDGVGLVAFAAVNHELGTIADAAAITAAAHAGGALVHVDAVQAAGKRRLGD